MQPSGSQSGEDESDVEEEKALEDSQVAVASVDAQDSSDPGGRRRWRVVKHRSTVS